MCVTGYNRLGQHSEQNQRTTVDPTAAPTFRVQSVALTTGTTSVSVTFSTSMSSSNYAVTCTLQNTTDSHPQFQPITVTTVSSSGFIANWNVALDSGNYFLNYHATTYV